MNSLLDYVQNFNESSKVDDITIDKDEYDKEYKTAMSSTETEQHLKASLDKIKDNIKKTKDALTNFSASSSTYRQLQKILIASVSKKKAIEDALKAKKNDTKFNIDTISAKVKQAIKTPISVRCNSTSSMTTAMQKMFKRMGLKNTVEVTKSSEYGVGIYYHFSVDGSDVQKYKVHSMDGNIGKFSFFNCVNDCICYAIIKNENLTGKDKQAVEDMFDTDNHNAPDWK